MGNSQSTQTSKDIDISHFKLRQIIGKGGFGVVRIVEKRNTKQKYALKYINKKKCIKKHAVRNIFRERIILESCDHPFIINLQFAFQDDEHMFMVIDLATGGDLRFHLVRNGILPEKTVRIYAAELSSAISYLHSNDILHRDIKPENLLIDARGHIHLTDFNVAIMLKEKIPTSRSGTTSYMAPEMFVNKPYTYSVDWWALGIVLFECTYNKHPFHGNGPSVENAILGPLLFPNEYEVISGKYPFVDSPERTDFIKRLLTRTVHERLGCGPQGDLEVKIHPWFATIDWDEVLTKKLKPDFIPDPSQNNYDFAAALEELLCESTPLPSKPVKKRRDKKEFTDTFSSLWNESMSSRKHHSRQKLEKELDYIEEYFKPYTRSPTNQSKTTTPSFSLIKMPLTQKEHLRRRSSPSRSRKSIDVGQLKRSSKTTIQRDISPPTKSATKSSNDIEETKNTARERESGRSRKEYTTPDPILIRKAGESYSNADNRTLFDQRSYPSNLMLSKSLGAPVSSPLEMLFDNQPSLPPSSPLRLNTGLTPVDYFDFGLKELDLSFPDDPYMASAPHSAKQFAKSPL